MTTAGFLRHLRRCLPGPMTYRSVVVGEDRAPRGHLGALPDLAARQVQFGQLPAAGFEAWRVDL